MAEMASDIRSGPKSDIEDLHECFNKDGFDGIIRFAKSRFEEWKKSEVDIAVTGNTGVGKSSFINAFLDLADDDGEAAQIGVSEATNNINCYRDKHNPNITFWDLPGVGSPRFPQTSYFEDTEFDKYDIFILIIANRFTENDKLIVRQLNTKGKVYFVVRSKVWNDVENSNRGRANKFPEKELIDRIRQDCKENIPHSGGKIYLIDRFEKNNTQLDFEKLRKDISGGLPDRRREALIRSIQSLTPNLIREKEKMLRNRIDKEALVSGAVAMIPIPGPSLAYDITVLMRLRSKFAQELGLTGDFLSNLLDSSSSASRYALIRNIAELYMQEWVEEAVKRFAINEVSEMAAKFMPFFGSLVSASMSFTGTSQAANAMLDKMVVDALKINEVVGEYIASELGLPYRESSV